MTLESKAALATQETEDSQEESQSTDPQEPDWKAVAEAAEADNAKLRNDLKAEHGRRVKALAGQDRDDDIAGLRAMITAVANRTASGETDALAGDIATLNQAAAQNQAIRTWAENEEEVMAALGEAIMDGDRALLAPEDIEDLKPVFKKAAEERDVAAYWRAYAQAVRLSRTFTEGEAAAALKAQKKASDKKHGINDMSTGNGSGGGTGMSWDQAQKSTDMKQIMDNYEKLIKES